MILAGITLLAVSLNCARSSAPDEVTRAQATLIAAGEDTAEPGWYRDLPAGGPLIKKMTPSPTITPEIEIHVPTPSNQPTLVYKAQAGDTLASIARRFGVTPEQVESKEVLPQAGFINPGQVLIIPNVISGEKTAPERLFPDSEIVYGPSAVGFDLDSYILQAGGYLSTHHQWLESTRMNTGAQIVRRVALEHSINPRLLLAILEYQSGWVKGQPDTLDKLHYPAGYVDSQQKDLYKQLEWVCIHLNQGYYAWRDGRIAEITLQDGTRLRVSPDLNAGTVAVQYFFAQLMDKEGWQRAMDAKGGILATYQKMFGDAWQRSKTFEPLIPPGTTQPALSLPFERKKLWALTGGPHDAWEKEGAWAALDFAPGSLTFGCINSDMWIVAPADGVVTRADLGIVALDLDGDGMEMTGWVLLFLHVAKEGRVQPNTPLAQDDKIGHPSCEGGLATGTHLHIARKFNGEWIPADGPLPFDLGGWIAHSDGIAYKGTLTRGDKTITANTTSPSSANVIRGDDDP